MAPPPPPSNAYHATNSPLSENHVPIALDVYDTSSEEDDIMYILAAANLNPIPIHRRHPVISNSQTLLVPVVVLMPKMKLLSQIITFVAG